MNDADRAELRRIREQALRLYHRRQLSEAWLHTVLKYSLSLEIAALLQGVSTEIDEKIDKGLRNFPYGDGGQTSTGSPKHLDADDLHRALDDLRLERDLAFRRRKRRQSRNLLLFTAGAAVFSLLVITTPAASLESLSRLEDWILVLMGLAAGLGVGLGLKSAANKPCE